MNIPKRLVDLSRKTCHWSVNVNLYPAELILKGLSCHYDTGSRKAKKGSVLLLEKGMGLINPKRFWSNNVEVTEFWAEDEIVDLGPSQMSSLLSRAYHTLTLDHQCKGDGRFRCRLMVPFVMG